VYADGNGGRWVLRGGCAAGTVVCAGASGACAPPWVEPSLMGDRSVQRGKETVQSHLR
jgi:hypothetical protein